MTAGNLHRDRRVAALAASLGNIVACGFCGGALNRFRSTSRRDATAYCSNTCAENDRHRKAKLAAHVRSLPPTTQGTP